MMTYWKNIIQFGLKSALMLKKNLIVNLLTTKTFLKTKIKSYNDEARDFNDKEMRRAGSNHTCLAVVNIVSALKKDKNYYPQVLNKNANTLEKFLDILLKIQNFFPISLMNESAEE